MLQIEAHEFIEQLIALKTADLAPRILMGLEESLPPALFAHTEVTFAHLGNDAGMLGALCNFLMRRGGKTAPEGTARNRSAVFGEAKEGR